MVPILSSDYPKQKAGDTTLPNHPIICPIKLTSEPIILKIIAEIGINPPEKNTKKYHVV